MSDPVVTQQVWTVTFDANGGTGTMAAQTFTDGVAQELSPNAFAHFGYAFVGWAESADGEAVYADGQRVAMSSGRTLYAQWAEIVAGRLDTTFAKAQTVVGALYNKDKGLVGTLQVKAGKLNKKKGTVKLSASATLLVGGKTKKVTAKAVQLDVGGAGATLAFKVPIGEMAFALAADGTFTLKNASYLAAEATVGGALKGGARGTFRLAGFDLVVPGELQEDLLPYEVAFDATGGKWKFAKAASVKWAKNKATQAFGRTVDESKGKTNRASLKLTYTAKTGIFKGSFKAYALEDAAGGKKKLKKYTVNVLGLVTDGKGQGEASCKKPAGGPWAVTVE